MDALEQLKKDNQIYERVSGGIITVTIEERKFWRGFKTLKGDQLLELLDNLQGLYKEKGETTNVALIEEEANGIVDCEDSKTNGARFILAKGVAKTSDENSNPKNIIKIIKPIMIQIYPRKRGWPDLPQQQSL